ncbi:uncharacterized protein K489DRAFT_380089 [Dissoconium aciculare CBS 342.82]|uniref:Ca3427-like PBP 2 domain-containing protein n=1 Tax=Dissoconium aciculare CBS 342.82 TaxID=1314786 RepID=A0A6J3M5B4_9PEZI|nr:uncharacterized protein K489DRAFT_380089 [Dissoconium aciculare CBS 342.82]KAF1822714.1 hypothetical protein K489DRAFT_380089 [Dissoconium aciculare CBS 342.82]
MSGIPDLRGKKVGVSRIGSGSYVMSFVLADQQGWLEDKSGGGQQEPFSAMIPIGDFAALRRSVREDRSSDFFMWEHFTTKHFWDNGELKRIGEIYTPWPSWMIAAREAEAGGSDGRVADLTSKLNQGVKHYLENKEEAIEYITSAMHYSREDALEWMKTVEFVADTHGVRTSVVDDVVGILRKAGVLDEKAGGGENMISIKRE